ncbi:MAG: DUF4124 domain-containing protein [Oleispira sp.]|nr:DUF4124 domain-containing protein [Oleispira sp.]MBL4881199.1 DUF4124 domain-containing protein [Oleispira sp.]
MRFLGLGLLVLFSACSVADAKLYMCVDERGRKTFQDVTCNGKADPVELQKIENLAEDKRHAAIRAKQTKELSEKYAQESRVKQYLQSLNSSLKSSSGYDKDSKVLCSKQWTKRGVLDSNMYRYCIKGHSDSYYELRDLDRSVNEQPFYVDYAYPYCSKRWTKRGVVDVTMLLHCLNQEVEGVEDVNFYRKKYGSVTSSVINRAMGRYGSWNMVAYTIKQSLGLD